MKRALLALSLTTLAAGGTAGGVAACSSSSGGNGSGADSGVHGDGAVAEAGVGTFEPEITCTDSVASIYADPGDVSGKHIGDILKCAKDPDLTAAQLMAPLGVTDGGNVAYAGKSFTSGAHVYRILYRTTRGDAQGTPGYSSALVMLPETPRRGVGQALPMIVASHGSRGQAAPCAPSLDSPQGQDVEEDFLHLVYPMVGLGFPVIAPDNAGYANWGGKNNPPPTYDSVTDVGRSVLDGARALRNLVPHSVTEQVVLTGHSQGGYTALAALSQADSYGSGGVISAVAVFAPLWLSQMTWAAVFVDPSGYPLSSSAVGPVSIWYHYTHSFLLDGPDAALELFDPTKAAVIQNFVQNDCWGESYPDLLEAGTTANDFFSKTYMNAIGSAATPILGNGDCTGNALCQTWIDRMKADYPHLTGGAAKVPILLYYAKADDTITPDGMQCVFNRLTGDQAHYQTCYDTNPVGHPGSVAENVSDVTDWIAQQTIPDAGSATLSHCSTLAPNEAGVPQLLTSDGGVQACNPLISSN